MMHLVLGGTGTVGSAVVRALLDHGEQVRVLTRSAERAKTLPAGAKAVIGDLTDPDTYAQTFTKDIDGLFLLNAVDLSELNQGLASVVEAKRAGVKRLVYLSVQGADDDPHLPHFSSKVMIEAAIKASGIPYTILRPNNFFQNDRWFLEAITKHGVYPQPIGNVGLSRIDVRDIATAAVNAFTKPGHENRTYNLAGPDALTGEQTAAAWAKALGRQVRYAGDDLVGWAASMRQYGMPGWMAYDFGLMYGVFQTRGFKASDTMRKETEAAIGGPARRFDDYVRETAASLSAAGR